MAAQAILFQEGFYLLLERRSKRYRFDDCILRRPGNARGGHQRESNKCSKPKTTVA